MTNQEMTEVSLDLGGVLLVYFILIMGLLIFFCLLYGLARYGLFKKAGYKGWEAFVPFYDLYILQSIAFGKEKGIYFLLAFVPVVGSFYEYYLRFSVARSFGAGDLLSVLTIFLDPFVSFYFSYAKEIDYKGPQDFFIK